MLCPFCHQLSARRNGRIVVEKMTKSGPEKISYQAYRCPAGHAYSQNHNRSPFTNSFIEYAVMVYLRSLSLNATVAILKIYYEKDILTKKTLLGLIEKVADRLPTLTDIDGLFHPQRSALVS